MEVRGRLLLKLYGEAVGEGHAVEQQPGARLGEVLIDGASCAEGMAAFWAGIAMNMSTKGGPFLAGQALSAINGRVTAILRKNSG